MTTPVEELDAEICTHLRTALAVLKNCHALCLKNAEQDCGRHASAFMNVTECLWRIESAIRDEKS